MPLIENISDLNALINSKDIVVFNVYRGSWCPFCKKYLRKFDSAFKSFPSDKYAVYGVSVDSESENAKFKTATDVNFPLICDAGEVFRSQLNNPISTSHPQARKTPDGYFLQPSIYIYQVGELKYQWQQAPKFLNLAGAVGRAEIDDIVAEVKKL